tara:strand:- start:35370 stop:36032 length:663 start_codon:yes stop_codon:yes gene_type:complete
MYISSIYNKDMRKLIKKLLRESLLDEGAFNSSHLPEGTGLFAKEQNSSELVLFNPSTKQAYAIINFVYNPSQSDFHYVVAVAADKGYGPLIYELAMMYVESEHTNLLTPTRSGDVRSEAFNVWKKMYNREDVIKKTLQPTDKNFKYDILFPTDEVEDDERQEAFDELLDNEKEALIVFNSGYTKEPSKGYYDLLRIAQQYDEDTYELASKIGDGLWKASY